MSKYETESSVFENWCLRHNTKIEVQETGRGEDETTLIGKISHSRTGSSEIN